MQSFKRCDYTDVNKRRYELNYIINVFQPDHSTTNHRTHLPEVPT